ncbi:hypothetical protein [Streptomyces justiciae]|uniref:hypothetical protein n=1 Tax=Streptomyces justiciae TaxID=2780140 RepID=UPI0021177AA9|nr:hypothetical protein [Streptomyces justiciae]MCW8384532.1 hypothetical protein [Streptomyces justiciae]
MHRSTRHIRDNEALGAGSGEPAREPAGPDRWPPATRAVTRIGRACVIEGLADFGLDDLRLVRDRFPHQHVTLDGDVITVWPAPLPHP